MDRDTYLKLLKEKHYNYIAYMYYIEKTGVFLAADVFTKLFETYLNDYAMRYLLDGESLLDKSIEVSVDYFKNKFLVNEVVFKESVINYY